MSEIFAMLPDSLESMSSQMRMAEMNAAAKRKTEERQQAPPFVRVGDVAVVSLVGPIAKHRTWWMEYVGGSATVEVGHALRLAAADASIGKVVLYVDSGGGEVRGVADLADVFAEVSAAKPTVAFCEDLCASAAYWVAAQARAVFANASGRVGSIGTYAVVHDMSAMAADMGIRVHVIRAGEFKGAGTAGTAISEAQLAEWQRGVDAINELFLAGVARGRRLPMATVRALADGRVHLAAQAKQMRLIDGVSNMDSVLTELTGWTPAGNARAYEPAAGSGQASAGGGYRGGDPISQWAAAVNAKVASGMPKSAAISTLVREQPELHRAYLEAYNAQARMRR